MELLKTLIDHNGYVAKFVFGDGTAISEVVAYKGSHRTVICFSVQSGCPIGCKFCGTGKRFIRNLTEEEIHAQIKVGLDWAGRPSKTQLMAMSMGEPMLNWQVVEAVANHYLSNAYDFYISTVGVFNPEAIAGIITLARKFNRFGLQISLHNGNEATRKQLLGDYPNLLTINQLRHLANSFQKVGGNPAYFNYICKGEETPEEAQAVTKIVGPHHLTCSVMCDTGAFSKAAQEPALRFGALCQRYPNWSHDWSIFDPAGQDTIGGGCGQLLFVQEFLAGKRSSQYTLG